MEKVLSIVVPSYNAEQFLLETIPTMASVSNQEKLEIIIVNDGSNDATIDLARKLENDYQGTIVVIDKENGGHGSTINAGINVARGKYFKVIDADDWVKTENLSSLIEYLTTCDDDEVISPFIKVFMDSETEEQYNYNVLHPRETYIYKEFLAEISEIPKMHAITIKTSILKENHIFIDENCFYVDLEYNTFPMPYIKTISYFQQPIYCYRLGTPTQSVSMQSYIKNIKMHEKVIFSLILFFNDYQSATPIEKNLLAKLIGEALTIHSNIYLAMEDSSQSKKKYKEFEKIVKEMSPLLFQAPKGNKIRLLRKSNYVLFNLLSKLYRKSLNRL
ncbi:TPA: glycosyltransferase family 2 protein [Streptococcus suis]